MLITLVAVFSCLTQGFVLTSSNVLNVLVQSSAKGIAAIGQAFVILTGGIDLSVGGIALFSSAVSATYMHGQTGYAAAAAGVAIMLLSATGIGSTTGLSTSRIKMPSLIITLALWILLEGASLRLTGGYIITSIPDQIDFFGQGRIGGFPIAIVIFIGISVIAYCLLNRSTFGRSVYATGGNPMSARLSGIDVNKIIFQVFAISGLCAGIAGLIIMSRISCFSMVSVTNLEMDSIAATVIGGISLMGGRGSIIGVVLGALILSVIQNGMTVLAIAPAYQTMAKGAIIYAAVTIDYLRRRE